MVIGIMVKEIVRITSTSTSTGGRRETQHESEGSSVHHLPRVGAMNAFSGGVIDAYQGGGALPGEKRKKLIGQLGNRG